MSLSVKGVTDSNRRPLDYGEPHGERSDQLSQLPKCRESRYRLLLQETYSTAIKKNLLSLQLFFTGLATFQYRRLYPANTSARRFCALLDMGATSAHCWGEEAYYLLSFRLTLLASR